MSCKDKYVHIMGPTTFINDRSINITKAKVDLEETSSNVPEAEAIIENDTIKFKFKNLKGEKGEQGERGYSADVIGCNTAIELAKETIKNANDVISLSQNINITLNEDTRLLEVTDKTGLKKSITLPEGDGKVQDVRVNGTSVLDSITGIADIDTESIGKEVVNKADRGQIAPIYSASSKYSIGEYCYNIGVFYECTTAITVPEPFNASHWKVADTVYEEIKKYSVYDNLADLPSINSVKLGHDLTGKALKLNCIIEYDGTYAIFPTDIKEVYNVVQAGGNIYLHHTTTNKYFSVVYGLVQGTLYLFKAYDYDYDNKKVTSYIWDVDFDDDGASYQAIWKSTYNLAMQSDLASKVDKTDLADTYDTTKSYAVGNYCIYKGIPYKCIKDTNGGDWISTSWESITILNELTSILTRLAKLENA